MARIIKLGYPEGRGTQNVYFNQYLIDGRHKD